MADWSFLAVALERIETSASYSWPELEALVGELPPSAAKHRAWWFGNRPHVHAWRAVGFSVANLVPGQHVTFVRDREPDRSQTAPTHVTGSATPRAAAGSPHTDLLLITCVKEKLSTPAPAQDLYVSALFKKERAYAEHTGLPWFILSAEHGLISPTEWLAPYERYLPDTPASFRAAWGAWVIERLELLTGPLSGKVVEIHAGAAYVDAIRSHLLAKGAAVADPLRGLTLGQRLAWYGTPHATSGSLASDEPPVYQEITAFRTLLLDYSKAMSPADFLAAGSAEFRVPGLYSWWADDAGAAELSQGLGLNLPSGLVYAGLAGATRWPSGKRSTNTLWSRISGMHLGDRHDYSTFRRTLGSILANARHQDTIDEDALTRWMHDHLKLRAVPFQDSDALGQLEEDVLRAIDPPLNLKTVDNSPIRLRIKQLRRLHGRVRDSQRD